ncbi:MAG TPA: glycosyltransferase [Acidimicrobiales bacterium]|nr:glycosyltransferase [Acidimicrobiales bacterium]
MPLSARSRPRRVALFTNHLMVGGAEAQLVRLAARLVARGDEVRLVSLLPTEAYEKEMAELGVPIVELRGGRVRSAAFVVQARRALKEYKPDVVVSFLYQANVVARVAAKLAGVPVVISSIRSEFFGGRARELVMRFTDPLATITTTNSALAAESLVRRKVAPRDRLVVVPNGLDVSVFDEARRQRDATRAGLGVTGDEFVWLAAGRLVPQKDVPNLLDGFAKHRAAHDRSRLLIAGDGVLHDDMVDHAARLGITDSVTFLGIREDLPLLMASADAFVLASAWEGLPNVVMEAMAAALPVVSTRVGGVAELVDDPATGVMVPPRDAAALSAAMNAVVELPADERMARGERGRAKIARDWSFDGAGDQWLTLIDSYAK